MESTSAWKVHAGQRAQIQRKTDKNWANPEHEEGSIEICTRIPHFWLELNLLCKVLRLSN